MAKESHAGENLKHGFSALRPASEEALAALSGQLIRRLGMTSNLSLQHFLGNAYQRPHARLFNSSLSAELMTHNCIDTLSRIALGATNTDPGLLEDRSIRVQDIEERTHRTSGSSYICAVPDAHSIRRLNKERRLLLEATATAFDRSPKGFLGERDFTISFARIGSKAKPADPAIVHIARTIVAEHCPERIPLGPILFQSVDDELFKIDDLVDHANKTGAEPIALYPLQPL